MGLVPYTNIEDGESADANVWNSRFGALLAQLNGNLDASNIRNGSLTRELFAGDAVLASWPVGSVYLSVEDTNPASLLGGGTWVRIAQGKALVGVDESDDDFDEAEKTAGTKTVSLTSAQNGPHTHSVNPPATNTTSNGAHTHTISKRWWEDAGGSGTYNMVSGGNGYARGQVQATMNSAGAHTHSVNIPAFNSASSGSGEAHNNVQPSFTIFVWKRVS